LVKVPVGEARPPFWLFLNPLGIDPVQTGDPAPMAEIFRVENWATAADRGLGDQASNQLSCSRIASWWPSRIRLVINSGATFQPWG